MVIDALESINARDLSKSISSALLEVLDQMGAYEVETKKTSLHISRGRAFLGIHPRATGLLLNIVTRTALSSERVARVEQVSRHRFHNEVLLTSPADVDADLIAWIAQAYRDCAP